MSESAIRSVRGQLSELPGPPIQLAVPGGGSLDGRSGSAQRAQILPRAASPDHLAGHSDHEAPTVSAQVPTTVFDYKAVRVYNDIRENLLGIEDVLVVSISGGSSDIQINPETTTFHSVPQSKQLHYIFT